MNEQEKAFAYLPAEYDFCYIMPDDSMMLDRVFKGDLLGFRAADAVENGRIAAVRVGGEVYVRRVHTVDDAGCIILAPSGFNDTHAADGIYNADEVQIVGLLVESHHQFVPPVSN